MRCSLLPRSVTAHGSFAAILKSIMIFCTNWLEEGLDVHRYWKERLESFNGYFIAANSWGEDSGISFCGQSAIISPGGKILAQTGKESNGIVSAEIECRW